MTTPVSTGPRRRALRSIGMWGAVGCGKTTFLAALYIAINRSGQDLNIFGVDDASTDFMVTNTRKLTNEHRFPDARSAVSLFSWTMNMTTTADQTHRTRFSRQTSVPAAVPAQFTIDLRDLPGAFFSSAPTPALAQSRIDLGDGADPVDMMDYLAGCEGLLLLIDPLREQRYGDAHEYFQGTLLRIAQRRLATMPPGSKLPHYVAVCITKFDDNDVYRFARMNGFRTYDENDPYLFPRVHSDDAESFFRELCNSDMSDSELIVNSLSKFFYRDRIRYFVTSAIGFYLKGGRFRADDHNNAIEQDGGSVEIRGSIHPINVLEPILWLGQSVTMVS